MIYNNSQIAFHLKPKEEISILHNVPDVYLPIMWFDEGAEIDEEWTHKFRNMVQVPFLLVDIFAYLGISVGALCFILGIVSLFSYHIHILPSKS